MGVESIIGLGIASLTRHSGAQNFSGEAGLKGLAIVRVKGPT